MFSEIRPKMGDQVIYWTPGDRPEDNSIPHIAIVCSVAREGVIEWRPILNLCVFRSTDCKPWQRLEIPAVWEDGEELPALNHRYSLPGEYPNDGTIS